MDERKGGLERGGEGVVEDREGRARGGLEGGRQRKEMVEEGTEVMDRRGMEKGLVRRSWAAERKGWEVSDLHAENMGGATVVEYRTLQLLKAGTIEDVLVSKLS